MAPSALYAEPMVRIHADIVEVYAPLSAGQVPRTRTRSVSCRSNLLRLSTNTTVLRRRVETTRRPPHRMVQGRVVSPWLTPVSQIKLERH